MFVSVMSKNYKLAQFGLLILTLVVVSQAQKFSQQASGSHKILNLAGSYGGQLGSDERVDKLSRASGDQYLSRQVDFSEPKGLEGLINAIKDQEMATARGQLVEPHQMEPFGLVDPSDYQLLSDGSYRSLVNDYKQWHSANPSRESRAYKPKLMSTARGFGKRSIGQPAPSSYMDLMGIANRAEGFADARSQAN